MEIHIKTGVGMEHWHEGSKEPKGSEVFPESLNKNGSTSSKKAQNE